MNTVEEYLMYVCTIFENSRFYMKKIEVTPESPNLATPLLLCYELPILVRES